MTDRNINARFTRNLSKLLAERGLNIRWLMVELNENANRIYPACRGETNISLELAARIAAALGASLDDLLEINSNPPKRISRILEKTA